MKYLLITAVLFANLAYAQDSFDKIMDEAKITYTDKPYMQNVLIKNLTERYDNHKVYTDKDKFIVSSRKFHKSRFCLGFMLDETTRPKFKELADRLDALPEMKEFVGKEFGILMNREIRRPITDGYMDMPRHEYHTLCEDKLPDDVVKDGIQRAQEKAAKAEAEYTPMDFVDFHPKLRKTIVSMRDDMIVKNKLSPSDADVKALMGFLGQILPILDTQAQLNTLPGIEKKCPGKVEEIWKLCHGKKFFEDSLILKTNPSVIKLLCMGDHKDKLVPQCISESEL